MKLRRVSARSWLRVYRDSALVEQLGRCRFCFCRLTRFLATADHLDPRAAGGADRRENIGAACADCNSAKGCMTEAQFRRAMKGRGAAPLLLLQQRTVRRINLAGDRACRRLRRLGGLPDREAAV